MEFKLKEIYGVLEVKNYELNFMVGIYHESQIKVLYKKNLEYRFCNAGTIIDEKNVAKELAYIIKDANKQLGISLQRIAVSVPNDHLQIKTSTKMLNLTQDRLITKNDIDALISLAKEVPALDDQTIFFIRPYRYIINEQKALSQPPIGFAAHKISIKSIVYLTKTSIIKSIFNMLKYAKVEIMGILPSSFSLAWNVASQYDLQNGIIIVDWDYDAIKSHVFVRETLCEQVVISGGVKKILNKLRTIMNCDNKQALKYLYKIINLNNDLRDNLIIYSKYNPQTKQQIKLTHADLRTIVNQTILGELEHLNHKLTITLEKYDYPIVVVGTILKISGFKEMLLKMNPGQQISVYLPEIVGAKEIWCTSLLGSIYYQHLANKVSDVNIQSVDEQYVSFPHHQPQPNTAVARQPEYPHPTYQAYQNQPIINQSN